MGDLGRVPFFQDAGIDFALFAPRLHWRRFVTGEVLIDYEEKSTDVYFLVAGEVRVLVRTQAGREIILDDMRAGQFFGELAAIDGVGRSANVAALTQGEVCVVPAHVFRDIVLSSPVVTERLLRLLAQRVRELNARLTEHAILDLRHRLYAELLRLSVPRNGHPGELVISPPPYHHVLAARIGCRREQVTREFTTLSRDGIVERTRGALVLRQPEVLRDRVSNAMREVG
ncbi:Crp/Fnr family transcriptional regulator [Pseudochelatococcus contaminans]|uniref:CRP-like cAMP-binding protein n=1 Tax=Pseudochelatococcus contaminans TaxID=1538103 RepID=A0A7W5Z1M8_9HYPH|nr:Crp/Fnr family transcriptional regulator [Pseudochelatococcus contaminans]MBB3808391.1 CRP-like cAMP-binding protein [Pseudochelatococcus contaminans]